MPRSLLWVAAAAMLVGFSAWAASAEKTAPSKPVEAVAAALCGRTVKAGWLVARAEALDTLERGKLPPPWRRAKAEEVEIWRATPLCSEATREEVVLVKRRLRALDLLRSHVRRAQITEEVAADVARLPKRQATQDEWPDSSDCRGCRALRTAEAEIAAVTSSPWPSAKIGKQTPLGERLDAAAQREPLIGRLCEVKPPPEARAEIETYFLYYSWTVNGARLLQVAELFEQPSLAAGCSRR